MSYQQEKFTAIADNIRTCLGTDEKIKPSNFADKIPEVFEAGKKSEYDEFWDNYQNYGNRTRYRAAFAGECWTNKTLNPKHPVILKDATSSTRSSMYMFYRCGTPDYHIDFSKLDIDFSDCITMNYTFANSYVDNIDIDCSSAISLANTFECNDGGNLTNIRLKVTDKCESFNRCFYYISSLKSLIFTDDSVIAGNGIDLYRSTALSAESIRSIINALSETTSNTSITLSLTAVNDAFETSEGLADGSTSNEWITLIATKSNWTISLM